MKLPAVFCLLLTVLAAHPCAGAGQEALHEEFATLDNWVPLTFPNIPRHSTYEVRKTAEGDFLVATSNNSASAIRYNREFDVYRYPVVRWRWKVDNVYVRGNLLRKSGDDYPLRVYVMFKYDPDRASFGQRAQYALAKLIYGAYPPQSSLNYIWANRAEEQGIHPSPYTDRARMIVLRAGTAQLGQWLEEKVNIVDDYRKAFGTEPPATASLAIMNDSDNTGEAATSSMGYIVVEENK